MNALQAIEQVLTEAGKPLRLKDILRQIQEQNLWQTSAASPYSVLSGLLAGEIKRKGIHAPIIRTEPGVYALRSWNLPVSSAPGSADEEVDQPGEARQKQSFTDAAQRVLESDSPEKPMGYVEIIKRAIALKYINPAGKHASTTLYLTIKREIASRERRGLTQRFILHPGVGVSLAVPAKPQPPSSSDGNVQAESKITRPLLDVVEQQSPITRRIGDAGESLDYDRSQVVNELHARLFTLPALQLERLISRLLQKIGFTDIRQTWRTDDDCDAQTMLVVDHLITVRMTVYFRRRRTILDTAAVRDIRGSLGAHEQGLIITTSSFTAEARKEASRPDRAPVNLMDGNQFVNYLLQYQIGIRSIQRLIIDLDAFE